MKSARKTGIFEFEKRFFRFVKKFVPGRTEKPATSSECILVEFTIKIKNGTSETAARKIKKTYEKIRFIKSEIL